MQKIHRNLNKNWYCHLVWRFLSIWQTISPNVHYKVRRTQQRNVYKEIWVSGTTVNSSSLDAYFPNQGCLMGFCLVQQLAWATHNKAYRRKFQLSRNGSEIHCKYKWKYHDINLKYPCSVTEESNFNHF